MPSTSKTPAGTGASRDSFAGLSLPFSNLDTTQAQFLIAAHHVRPEMAAMIAALAFGGGAHG
ncbi:MAG: hypothetical protein ACN4E6_14925 [Qipengyuania pacifica]